MSGTYWYQHPSGYTYNAKISQVRGAHYWKAGIDYRHLAVADDACDLNFLPRNGRSARVDHILTNSFGFGGINAALVLRRVS